MLMPMISDEHKRFFWLVTGGVSYCVMFLLLPLAGELINETFATICVILFCLLFPVFAITQSIRPRHFFFQWPVLYSLVMMYHPKGIYGIHTGGMLDFSPAWLDALMITGLMALGQWLAALVYAAGKKLYHRFR